MPFPPFRRKRRIRTALVYPATDEQQVPSKLEFGGHARKRMKQRAIPPQAIMMVLQIGCEYHAGAGYTAYHLGHRVVDGARDIGVRIDHAKDISIVVSPDGVIFTVQHMNRIPRS